jgi:DNA polymerase-3 subunit beta
MNTSLFTEKLREALNKNKVAVAMRSSLPICSTVLVEALGGKLILRTTNLQDDVTTSVPCTASETFKACVPYRTFSQFVSKGDGKVTVDFVSEKRVSLERPDIGKVNLKLGYKTADFPTIPKVEGIEWHTLDAKLLCRFLSIVVTGCAKEESRPVLTAVYLKDGAIAAADGFRLYSVDDPRLTFGLGTGEALLEWTSAQKVVAIFGKKDKVEVGFKGESVTLPPNSPLVIQPTTAYFKSDDTMLVCRLVQGNFPKYRQLIPTAFKTRASFSAPLMMERLNVMNEQEIKDASGILRMHYHKTDKNEDVCSLLSQCEESFEYELSLPVKLETEGAKIAVNYRYFKEAVKWFAQCDIELTSPSSPMKITGDIKGLSVIIMPMFVQW